MSLKDNVWREKLRIPEARLNEINDFLTNPDNKLFENLFHIIEKYGGVDEINRKAREAGKLENLMDRLKAKDSPYVADLEWLIEQSDKGAFITIADYRRKILGARADNMSFDESFAVTLEISSLHYFPWLITEAKQAIANQELMPSRFIRVRYMKEQEADDDLLATVAAMNIIGASWCETLDTKGTDGSNVHLGGPDTILGYFGGVGQPNDYSLKWIDEYLYYLTNYGVNQVLNINFGTVLLGLLLRKLGVDNEFKISVFTGHDNPYYILWTLMMAKLLSRDDGSTALIGLNFSNSVSNETVEISAEIRKAFNFEDVIRFEHHIFETCYGIVRQPYDRREELPELAHKVKNISAKHEGAEPEVEASRGHPSNILEYFLKKEEVLEKNMMADLMRNYLDKHDAVNNTAKALTEKGLTFVAAKNLHKQGR